MNFNFKLEWDYTKKLKNYVFIILGLFLLTTIFGFIFPNLFEQQILQIISDLLEKTKNLSAFELIDFIIFNNAKTAFFGLIFGIFFGLIPITIAVVNGYVLGFVISKTVVVEGVSVLWRLLPHGIFELPAIILSLALGLKLGISLFYDCIIFYNKNISKLSLFLLIILSILFFPISFIIVIFLTIKNKGLIGSFKMNLINSLKVFIFIVLPFLVLAGIIEGLLIWLLG